MTSQFLSRTVILLVAILYLNFLSRIALAPLLPVIASQFALGHGEAGFFFLFIASGYCIGLLGSPFVSSRLNHRHIVPLSAIALGGSMLAMSRSVLVPQIYVGLSLLGFSAGFYMPSGIAILTELVSKEHWGKGMAVHEMAPNLAFFTAPLLAEAFLGFVSWRGVIGIIGIWSILAGVLFSLLGQGGTHKGAPLDPKLLRTVLTNRPFWIMAIVFALSTGACTGAYTMLPLFLVDEIGFGRQVANTIIGYSRLSGFLALFLSGLMTDRIGQKRSMLLFATTTAILTLGLGLFHGVYLTPVLVFLQAASSECLFPPAFAMVSSIFPSRLRGAVISMVLIVGFLFGLGVVPAAIGYLADILSFSYGFSLLGALVLAILPALLNL